MAFVGRTRELAALQKHLDKVLRGTRLDRGTAVMIRGRRRVGKSRLAGEFVRRAALPYVHFQASRNTPPLEDLQHLRDAVVDSSLPGSASAHGIQPTTLSAALQVLALALPDDSPSIVVIDELPWLLEGFAGGAGELQRAWDLTLSRKPVLLLLLGSDLSMMESLTRHDQPFHGRAAEMVLRALNPRDVAELTGTSGMDAFDAHLITGGQPLVAEAWEHGMTLDDFLRAAVDDSSTALVVNGLRILESEFSETSLARRVLTAIGGRGERTFSAVQQAATSLDPIPATSLSRTLHMLRAKRVVAFDEPLSMKKAPKDRRYRIDDPALRFWLAFVEPHLNEIDAGRGDIAHARVLSGYPAWRGRAVEPVVREAVWRLAPSTPWPDVKVVGNWWPRTNRPEVDLVGADDRPAHSISFTGTIKWRADKPLTSRDAGQLLADSRSVPGATENTAAVGVCPAGADDDANFDLAWTADDLLTAWR
ncbi:ATP-binding protein [Myceligenerans salitolerans]|uniref:ATP-binding protein n=1 Tax=Myceligenerans salitolerans TaxID=1230528 RepID=A0ABS3I861_9MICO|nr:ATP-binding protein [Myceligenerans salitolerans]MBO0609129.1 ATP-binding protein [Myceligenerans salitolerans]